jgi:hypothetical protein
MYGGDPLDALGNLVGNSFGKRGRHSGRIKPDIKAFVDLSFVFRAEDREPANF